MVIGRSWTGAACALALAACSSERGPAESLTAPGISLNEGNGVELHVQGAGVIDFTAAGAGFGDFQLVAHRKADGTVSGHFRQRRFRPDGVVDFTGVVTCVTIDPAFPGRARIGGVVTKNESTSPAFLTENHDVGDDVWFRVTDAAGGTDPEDASTTYGFKPTLVNTSAEYCALPFTGLPAWNPASIFPLARGTIQVSS